jgi:hypothetical protein
VQALRSHGQVVLDRLDAAFLELDRAGLLALAHDAQEPALEVDVVAGEGTAFTYANACLEKDLQDGVIA